MKYESLTRIKYISYLIILLAAILIARLFQIQVIEGDDFNEMALRQYSKPLDDIFSRGSIFFKEKNNNLVSAAILKTNYLVTINPMLIKEPEKVFDSVLSSTTISKKEFLERAAKKNDPYEVVGKIEDESVADEIKEKNILGLRLYPEKVRYYPAGKLASHVLGFVSKSKEDEEKYTGKYGMEKQYEGVLHRDSESVYVNFFAEIFSNISKTISGEDNELTGDIILSIEPTVEGVLLKEIYGVQEKWKGKISGGIIIEPKTGRIVAMSATPDFDPNIFGKEKEMSVFRNPLVENVYEMGSIMKPLTVAAGLDSKKITAATTYNDKGFVELNGKTINNFDKKGRGVVDIQTALGNSLNTGMVFVMQKLGKDKFREYMLSYGLGEKTGIDLPNETKGLIQTLNSKYEVDYATASFGQGIAVTPIQTACALYVLANGGYRIKPTITDSIKYRMGMEAETEHNMLERVIKPETSEEITRMLVKVVDENLLGGTVKLKNYSVAAKTGTALLNNETGGYYDDRFIHTFFGYFPAYNPKFLIFLYTTDPKGVDYASASLTEPFFNLTKFLISYYEIPPDR